MVFNYGRSLLRGALDNGSAEQIGLDRAFIAAMPVGGPGTRPAAATPSLTKSPRRLRTRPTCSSSPTATTRTTGA